MIKTNNMEPLTKMKFEKSSKDLKALTDALSNILHDEIEKINKKAKKKGKQAVFFENVFEKDIQTIADACQKYIQQTPLALEEYFATFEMRKNNFKSMLFELEAYPIKNITNQLKQQAKRQGIDPSLALAFIRDINNSILRLVVTYTFVLESKVIEEICANELHKIKTNYYLKNTALQLYNKEKYQSYVHLIQKTIHAYTQDFKCFIGTASPYFEPIEQFLDMLLRKVEALVTATTYPQTTQTATLPNFKSFPTHIFRNQEAFALFHELANQNTTQDGIGFLFRQMSEIEEPALIVAKETSFRNWFNTEFETTIELTNAIKCYRLIKGIKVKNTLYQNARNKYIFLQTNQKRAA